MNISEILDHWNTGDGKPYKGELIDWESYLSNPSNLGCMCAQGQVLHLLGGWDAERLHNAEQVQADKEVAELLNISVAHAILLRQINDTVDGAPSIVLTDPGEVLGGEWSRLLDFWWHLDQMTAEQWAAARASSRAAAGDASGDAAWDASRDASGDASRDAARDAARAAAWAAARAAARASSRAAAGDASGAAAWDASGAAAWDAAWASNEIQGAHLLRERGQPFFFLPLFGFAAPEDIPDRPLNYGKI